MLRFGAILGVLSVSLLTVFSLEQQKTVEPLTSRSPEVFTKNSVTTKIPILVYHHIRETKPYPKSTWSYKMSVSPDVFRAQMQWLLEHGYTTITLDTLTDIFSGKIQGPTKPVVITFDDNQRSQYEIAFPLLKANYQIAVFYLITNRLQNSSFILEDEVRAMSEVGMDIQSHSITHSILTNLSSEAQIRELTESRLALEQITSKPVRHIAYPLTAHNQKLRDRTKDAGYTTGTIMDPRTATIEDDFFKLPRIMMTDDTVLERVLP